MIDVVCHHATGEIQQTGGYWLMLGLNCTVHIAQYKIILSSRFIESNLVMQSTIQGCGCELKA